MSRTVITAAITLAAATSTTFAQTPPRPEPVAEVLILGTYHFANPGQDQYNARADDVLAPRRQQEILDVVDRLAAFRPTIVAVEAMPDSAVNERYSAWRAGEVELTANERQQLGFRLAARFDIPDLALVDANHPFMAEQDLALDVSEPHLAALNTMLDRLGNGFVAEEEHRQTTHSIGEMLAWMNTEAMLDANSDIYLGYFIRRWGADGNPGGAYTVGNWYTRNLLIFQNIMKVVEGREDERILLIIGQGHAPILRYLVEESPWLTLADPLDYLPAVPDAPAPE